ncbi:MAG: ABC transporter permease [Chloroflexota bacterium]|jgi:peptide/nickel transport system permease protein
MAATYTQLPTAVDERPGLLRRAVRAIRRDWLALFGLVVIAIVLVCAVLGPWLAPDPGPGSGTIDMDARLLPPSREYPFGTDWLGRDMLSRVILGARIAVQVSLIVVGLAILIGVPLGAIAGYRRGRVDGVIMRITDLFLAFPPLLLAMAIVAALGPGLQNATLALVISWWPWYTRIARGLAVSLREWPFVDAARAMGIRDSAIVFRHIVPNSVGPIVVQATIDIGTVILAAGGLAFIGLGARPPAPDWGLMVAEGRQFILDEWWISTFPGLAIFFTVLAFNLVGDLLLRLLDPRQED